MVYNKIRNYLVLSKYLNNVNIKCKSSILHKLLLFEDIMIKYYLS